MKQKHIIYKIAFIFSFLVYLAGLLKLTLFKYFPVSMLFSSERFYLTPSLNLIPFADWNIAQGGMIRDIILNVILFVPFGFLLAMRRSEKRIRITTVLVPFIFSILIEAFQYMFASGVTDITDVISNTLGAFLGALLYFLFYVIFQRKINRANNVILIFITLIAIVTICLML